MILYYFVFAGLEPLLKSLIALLLLLVRYRLLGVLGFLRFLLGLTIFVLGMNSVLGPFYGIARLMENAFVWKRILIAVFIFTLKSILIILDVIFAIT
jgi:hypothetical protein